MLGIKVDATKDMPTDSIILTVRFDYVRAAQVDAEDVAIDTSFSPLGMYIKQEHIDVTVAHKITMETFALPVSTVWSTVLYILEDVYRKAHPNDDNVDDKVFNEIVDRAQLALAIIGFDITDSNGEYHPGGFITSDEKLVSFTPLGGTSYKSPVETLKNACAGLDELVYFPKGTQYEGQSGTLYQVIQAINDTDRWTREQIADWLESLDVDITVNLKE